MGFLLFLLHFAAFTAIVVVAAWGTQSGVAGDVTSAIVIGLAMLPLFNYFAVQRHEKPLAAWKQYAIVGWMAGVTALVRLYHPPRWSGVAFLSAVLAIGLWQSWRRNRALR